jgi:hypothetical protein
MAFDVHAALVRKQEHESAKLDEFAFRQRARAIRLLVEWALEKAEGMSLPGIGALDPVALASEIATASDEELVGRIAVVLEPAGITRRRVERRHQRLKEEAWLQLAAEMGDPTPRSLA